MKYDTSFPTVFAVQTTGHIMETQSGGNVNVIEIDFDEIEQNPAYALEVIVALRHIMINHDIADVRETADGLLCDVFDAVQEVNGE